MNSTEKYEFDRLGYLVIPQLLSADQVASLSEAVNELEAHALAHIAQPPRVVSPSFHGMEYHRSEDRGYHATGSNAYGHTVMIEDFWNAGREFDLLLDHGPTLAYIREVVQERPTINNSEIRIRYSGNATGTHMGGPIQHKYRYAFTGGKIDCMMVRMIYFLQDVGTDQGPFCVVPGTHKTNFSSPYSHDPTEEPGMIGLEVHAGDAILFTENLRHGGLPNRSTQTRKTIHVGYGPPWMLSQNIATMDEPAYITPTTRARLTQAQNNLFRAWPQ